MTLYSEQSAASNSPCFFLISCLTRSRVLSKHKEKFPPWHFQSPSNLFFSFSITSSSILIQQITFCSICSFHTKRFSGLWYLLCWWISMTLLFTHVGWNQIETFSAAREKREINNTKSRSRRFAFASRPQTFEPQFKAQQVNLENESESS